MGALKLLLGNGEDTVRLGYGSSYSTDQQVIVAVDAKMTMIDGGEGADAVVNGNVVNSITPTVIVMEKGFETTTTS
jgi:hypothetical protein